MNIIEAVKQLINDYPDIAKFSNEVHVDYTEDSPTNFGISSTGDALINEDILGNQLRQHNFVLYAVNQSFTDYDRLSNSTFLLEFAYWLETINGQEVTATINDQVKSGKITKLSSANAMLFSIQNGDMNNGVTYQIQIYANYKIESEE
jgi:nanoRNase/pAp phosphatase (c-di-AMP/oligoRNAs hydrolase)